MNVHLTGIAGCFLLEPQVLTDSRGLFFESYHRQKFQQLTGVKTDFVQDNESFSTKGVLRGLHFQKGRHAQAKLVRVVTGAVLDVAVDCRPQSDTFGQVVTVHLSADNKKQLFIPRGCAHGFVTLSDTAAFLYKCDNFYHPAAESGIVYNDPTLGIDWLLPEATLILSEKDKAWPSFTEAIAQSSY